jgi:hypothetical protein
LPEHVGLGCKWSFIALSCQPLKQIWFDLTYFATSQSAEAYRPSTAAAIPDTIASQHELAISRPRHPCRKAGTPNSTPRLLQPTTPWQGCSKPRRHMTLHLQPTHMTSRPAARNIGLSIPLAHTCEIAQGTMHRRRRRSMHGSSRVRPNGFM